ncbi:MAG: zinc ribbon domain-containing protein [Myxococcales bacterium]|nr:zinc ribbon domain-containing protein [Myxococcales bacterium]
MATKILVLLAMAFLAFALSRTFSVLSRIWRSAELDGSADADQALADLINAKRQVLAQIKDTELDFETGKIDDAHYAELRERSIADAVALTRKLDEIRDGLEYADDINQRLENLGEVEPLVEDGPQVLLEGADSTVGASQAAQLRAVLKARSAKCGACEASVAPTDRFCPKCGNALHAADPETVPA